MMEQSVGAKIYKEVYGGTPIHPSFAPFKCPACGSRYFGPIFVGGEHVGRYCKGWPRGFDRSHVPCRGTHEEMFIAYDPSTQSFQNIRVG